MAFERTTKSTRVFLILKFLKHLFILLHFRRIHIAVTKLHTKKGVAEKFVNDLKEAVARIMTQKDRKLGKIVSD